MVEVIGSFSIERIISYLLCQGEYIYYKKRMYNILYSNAVRPVMCWSWNFPTIRHTKSWGLDSLNELNTSTFYWSVSIKPGKCVYCICVFWVLSLPPPRFFGWNCSDIELFFWVSNLPPPRFSGLKLFRYWVVFCFPFYSKVKIC